MNTSLHSLIHGLSQSEKRYFTLAACSGSEEDSTRYYRLYEAILEKPFYDEKMLKQQVGEQYFAQYKKQLEEKILSCLRQFHAGKSMTAIVNDEIRNARIYQQKGLFKRAEKSLQRAEILARRHELLPELVRVFDDMIDLLAKTATAKDIRQRIPVIRKEIATIHQLIDHSLLIRQEYLHFTTLNKENEFLREQQAAQNALNLITNLLVTTKNQPLTAQSTAQLYYLQGLCHFLCGNFTESKRAFSREYTRYTQHPFLLSETTESLDKCLGNNALLALATGESSEFERYFAELSQRMNQQPKKSPIDTYRCYLLQLKSLVKQHKWNEGKQFIRANESAIQPLEKEFLAQQLLGTELDYVMFDTLRIHLELYEYREARQLLRANFHSSEITQKPDNYTMARMIFIILQLQQEQIDLAESEIRSLKRFIRKNKRTVDFENRTLACLTKLVTNPLPEKQHQTIHAFIASLEKMPAGTDQEMALFCFDLPGWLKGVQFQGSKN